MIDVYMKRLLSGFKNTRGFTLIELLVVIGILGVLAAALIATIDPFEQIKKANDANSKNTAVEFVTANIRYYTTHSALPWAANEVSGCSSAWQNLTAAGGSNCIAGLVTEGELKSGFANATNILKSIRYGGSATSVTACFNPVSKAQLNDSNTLYNSNGSSLTGCPGGSSCYWCTQ